MSRYTPSTPSSFTAVRGELDKIADTIETLLDREGTLPNQMQSDLDMNGYEILNADFGDIPSGLVEQVNQNTQDIADIESTLANTVPNADLALSKSIQNELDIDNLEAENAVQDLQIANVVDEVNSLTPRVGVLEAEVDDIEDQLVQLGKGSPNLFTNIHLDTKTYGDISDIGTTPDGEYFVDRWKRIAETGVGQWTIRQPIREGEYIPNTDYFLYRIVNGVKFASVVVTSPASGDWDTSDLDITVNNADLSNYYMFLSESEGLDESYYYRENRELSLDYFYQYRNTHQDPDYFSAKLANGSTLYFFKGFIGRMYQSSAVDMTTVNMKFVSGPTLYDMDLHNVLPNYNRRTGYLEVVAIIDAPSDYTENVAGSKAAYDALPNGEVLLFDLAFTINGEI